MSSAVQRPIYFKSTSHQQLDLGFFRIIEATFTGPQIMNPHYHERPTLGVFLQGRMDKHYGRHEAEIDEGTAFVMPAQETHVDDFPAPLSRTLVLEANLDHPDAAELFDPFRRFLDSIHAQRADQLFAIASRNSQELRQRDEFTAVSVSGLGFDMLAEAARLRQVPREQSGHAPRWLYDAQEFLHENFAEKIQVADVAREVDIHPVHLSRMFREHVGLPVGAYIRKVRLEWAAERLAKSDDSITIIAIESGFADQSHFTRTFRRAYGVTPGRYRREMRR